MTYKFLRERVQALSPIDTHLEDCIPHPQNFELDGLKAVSLVYKQCASQVL